MSGWRDISTAPKDGTWVLLYRDGQVEHGSWGRNRLGDERWLHRHGWYPEALMPTHWMPAPGPPEEITS